MTKEISMQHTWNKLKVVPGCSCHSQLLLLQYFRQEGFCLPPLTISLGWLSTSKAGLNWTGWSLQALRQCFLCLPDPRVTTWSLSRQPAVQREHHSQQCAAATGILRQGWTCRIKAFIIYRKPPNNSTERTGLVPRSLKTQSKISSPSIPHLYFLTHVSRCEQYPHINKPTPLHVMPSNDSCFFPFFLAKGWAGKIQF